MQEPTKGWTQLLGEFDLRSWQWCQVSLDPGGPHSDKLANGSAGLAARPLPTSAPQDGPTYLARLQQVAEVAGRGRPAYCQHLQQRVAGAGAAVVKPAEGGPSRATLNDIALVVSRRGRGLAGDTAAATYPLRKML